MEQRQAEREPLPRSRSYAAQRPAQSESISRSRAWCEKWLGAALIAAGWVLAFAAILMPTAASWLVYRFETAVFAAALFGLGAGWQMRGSR